MKTIKNYRSETYLQRIGPQDIKKQNHRSNSEINQNKKPNYHFTQQKSEERKDKPKIQSKNQFQIKPKTNNQPVDQQVKDIKLPDLKVYQLTSKPPKGANSSLLQQQSSQLKNRLQMYDLPPSRGSKMPKLQKNDSLTLSCQGLSKAGFDGYQVKENQDRELIYSHSQSERAFGVMDGHGQDGDKVSQFILESILYMMKNQFEDFDFKWAYPELQELLKQHPNIGSQFSGTTITVAQIKNNQIVCGWLGDSRAVICKRNKNKRPLMIESIDLSHDHKPNLPEEKERIENSGGVVDSYHAMNGAQLGPYRVWVKGTSYPGLAMSRSLGDQVAASVGVSQIPDIKKYDLTGDELFLIIASDGVWEFLSSYQAVEIVYQFYLKNDIQSACQKLYQEANSKWKQLDDGIDDITSVIVFFNY